MTVSAVQGPGPAAADVTTLDGTANRPDPAPNEPLLSPSGDLAASGEDSAAPILPPAPPFDGYRTLVRLVVGAVVEGSEALLQRLEAGEASYVAAAQSRDEGAPEPASDLVRYALVGLAFEAAEGARRRAVRTARLALGVGRLSLWPVRPLLSLGRAAGFAIPTQDELLRRWSVLGRAEEPRSRALARGLLAGTIQEMVEFLGRSPATASLVDEQVMALLPQLGDNAELAALVQAIAGRYLLYLEQNPELADGLVRALADGYLRHLEEHPEQVQDLIRAQGDTYLVYLHQIPEQVQDLIQGQSLNMGAEVLEEVRGRTVTADSLLEAALRRLLRRPPRSELPVPPDDVQTQAVRSRRYPAQPLDEEV